MQPEPPATLRPLLAQLRSLGVQLQLSGLHSSPELRLQAPRGTLTPALQQALREAKTELIAWLQTQARYPLSPLQRRLWFVQQLEPHSARYHETMLLEHKPSFDLTALQTSFQQLYARHAGLRASFYQDSQSEPGLWQQIAPANQPVPWHLGQLLSDAPHDQAPLEAWLRQPFDLQQAPLLRLSLWTRPDGSQLLGLVFHHLIIDALAASLLLQEWLALLQPGPQSPSGPLPVPRQDYRDWLLQLPASTAPDRLSFWQRAFADIPPVLALPRSAQAWQPLQQPVPDQAEHCSLFLPPELDQALSAQCRQLKVTRFVWILGAWQAFVLSSWRLPALLLALPGTRRQQARQATLIACLVETLLLPARWQPAQPFDKWLQALQQVLPDFLDPPPFENLVQLLNPPRDLPFFPQLCLNVQEALPPELSTLQDRLVPAPFVPAKFELLLNWLGSSQTLQLQWPRGWYPPTEMQHWLAGFVRFCQQALQAPHTPLQDLLVLAEAIEARQLQWARPRSSTPPPRCLPDYVRQVAATAPERVALRWQGQDFSYGWLADTARQWAQVLQSRGAGAGERIALQLPVCPELIAAMLAIVSTRAAYVPLDPEAPPLRLQAILQDAAPRLWICAEHDPDSPSEAPPASQPDFLPALPRLSLGQLQQAAAHSTARPQVQPEADPQVQPEDLAYIIYTSGSTGQPNGVAITHTQLSALFSACSAHLPFTADQTWLLFHSVAFDFSVWEIWGAFYGGSRLVLLPRESARDPQATWQIVCAEGVSLLNQTPSAFGALCPLATAPDSPTAPALRHLLLSGEALQPRLLKPWFARFGGQTEVINAYGITETTVLATWQVLQATDPDTLSATDSPIGVPLAHLGLQLLNAAGETVPDGMPAEIVLNGPGLGHYWQRPELNQSRFQTAPDGSRRYFSGDLAVMRQGQLHFLRRRDQQLQLRGHRIESGEILAALYSEAENAGAPLATAEVMLLPAKDTEPLAAQLVAAVVFASPAQTLSESRFKSRLRQRLSPVMLPARMLSLPALPRNQSGKVDKAALQTLFAQSSAPAPNPQAKNRAVSSSHKAALRQLLAELLQRPETEIGDHDNFFDLGAHSLLLVEARSRIMALSGRELSLLDLFQHPNLQALSQWLDGPATTDSPDQAQARGRERPVRQDEAIAVIGMALRFPGASSPEAFWELLVEGREGIQRWSAEQLATAGVPGALYRAPDYVPASGWCEGVYDFAAEAFGFSAREARQLDPQQRLMLELGLEALERAGYGNIRQPQPIGVFASTGISRALLAQLLAGQLDLTPQAQGLNEAFSPLQLLLAHDKDFLASRVAYKLNLTGPALMVQSACSSSLLAIYQACESLRRGECQLALAGGINLDSQPQGYRHQPGGIYAADGHCRPFDAEGSGIVGGSGGAWVLLKPLRAAEADGDPIYCLIGGGAVNNDGANKAGYLAPGIAGQQAVIEQALQRTGLAPEAIGYLEAHGTGTRLGDPIELRALRQAWQSQQTGFCALGSVKGNLGHLDAAAGVASLIKVALMLQQRQKVPSINVRSLNPELQLAQSPFYLARHEAWDLQRPWAGVSALGMGGTNVHLLCRLYNPEPGRPPTLSEATPQPSARLLLFSAPDAASLQQWQSELAGALQQQPEASLSTIAQALQQGRQHWPWRAFSVLHSRTELPDILAPTATRSGQAVRAPEATNWLCPGLGAQQAGLQELHRSLPAYAEALDQGCQLLQALGWPYSRNSLLAPAAPETMQDPLLMQPAIFVQGFALACAWQDLGLQPAALIGHSFGELLAACLGGMASFEALLPLVLQRARWFARLQQQSPPGGVLSLRLAPGQSLSTLPGLPPETVVASQNGPGRLSLSGPRAALSHWLQQNPGLQARWLPITHVVHHPWLEHTVPEEMAALTACADRIDWQTPQIPVWSCLAGHWHTKRPPADYWARQALAPFDFGLALQALPGDSLVLELSLQPQLSRFFQQAGHRAIAPPGERHQPRSDSRWLAQVGQLWQHGQPLSLHRLFARKAPDMASTSSHSPRFRLPATPLPRQHFAPPLSVPVAQATAVQQRRKPQHSCEYLSWQRLPHTVQPRASATADDSLCWQPLSLQIPLAQNISSRLCLQLSPEQGQSMAAALQCWQQIRQIFAELQARRWQGQLLLVTPAVQPFLCPAALWPLLSIPARLWLQAASEQPGWQTFWLDCDGPGPALEQLPVSVQTAGSTAADPARSSATLLWRAGSFWQPCWQTLHSPHSAESPWREGGVYLITGASGGMGRALARQLCETLDVRLLLISRQPAPADLPPILAEALGQRVHWLPGDICQPETLEQALHLIQQHFGTLNGVIHAAGVSHLQPLGGLEPELLHSALAAKTEGALQLAAALAKSPFQPDFVLLCSSLAARETGALPGQGAYGAANSALDALALQQRQQGRAWLSLQWGPWRESGMAERLQHSLPTQWQAAYRQYLQQGFSDAEGFTALGLALQTGLQLEEALLSASPLAPAALLHWQRQLLSPPAAFSKPQQTAVPPMPDSKLPLLAQITALWQTVLERPTPIAPDQRFSDCGGDSLQALQMHSLLEQALARPVPLGLIQADLPAQALAEALDKALEEALAKTRGQIPLSAPDTPTDSPAETGGLSTRRTASGQASELLVPLNRTALQPGAPGLFVVHAISGTVFPFRHLAEALDARQLGLSGLQSAGLTQADPHRDITHMAQVYRQAIMAQQAPPYRLGGWSFGALVAFEMARQWAAEDSSAVSQLILLDMYAPNTTDLQPDEAGLRARFEADLRGLARTARPDPTLEARLFSIFEAHVQASRSFKPGPLQVPTLLLRAAEGFGSQSSDPTLGWGPWLPELQVVPIPGDHYSCLLPEQITQWQHWL